MNAFFFNSSVFSRVLIVSILSLVFFLLPGIVEKQAVFDNQLTDITIGWSVVEAQTSPPSGSDGAAEPPSNIDTKTKIPELCGFGPRSFLMCLGEWGLGLTGYMLSMSGKFFDFMLLLTLDTSLLGGSTLDQTKDYIQDIWANIRDMANLGFIFALLFISFSLIFSWKAQQAKSLFTRVVIIALLLNFSLFISKVIIDAGNITAMTFYNAMTDPTPIDENSDSGTLSTLFGPAGYDKKGVSGAIAQGVNPTKALTPESFKSMQEANNGKIPYGSLAFLYLTISAVTFMLAKEIIIASFMFISRTVWLILLMVLSPLAFVSYLFPPTQKYFTEWFTNIVDRSFCVVIFLFFIWLLIQVVGGMNNVFAYDAAGQSWTNILLIMIIQFGITYSVLKIANAQTLKRCDGGSGLGAGLVNGAKMVGGAALMVGTGGAGMVAKGGGRLARSTIGQAGFMGTESTRFSRWATDEKNPAKRLIGNSLQFTSQKLADSKMGLPESAAERIDRRKDTVKKQMNRDANNLEREAKNMIKSGMKERDVRKRLNLDKDAKDEALTLKEVVRKRASIRAEKSGVFGKLAAGVVPLGNTITPNIADEQAATEFNKQTMKDAEKRWKTNRIQEAKEKMARAAAIEKADLDDNAQGLARETVRADGPIKDQIRSDEFKKSFDGFMSRLASTFETNSYDKQGVPIMKDGVQVKSISPDASRQIEAIRGDLWKGFHDVANNPSTGEGAAEKDTQRLEDLLASKTKIGKEGIDSGLRAAQNMAAIEVENVVVETAASIEDLDTNQLVDQQNLGMDADLIKGDPGSAKRAIAKEQKEERRAKYEEKFSERPLPDPNASAKTDKEVAAEKRRDRNTKKDRQRAAADRAELRQITQNEFDELESLISRVSSSDDRTDEMMSGIRGMFKDVPNPPDFNAIQKMDQQSFTKALKDSMKNNFNTGGGSDTNG